MSNKKKVQPPAPQSRQGAGRQRDSSGRFVKGVSGNPGGTKHLSPEMKKFAQDKSLKGMKRLDKMLDNPDTQDKDVIAVVRLFLEYGYGRPAAEYDREKLDIDKRMAEARIAQIKKETDGGPQQVEVLISNQAKEWGK